MKKTITCTVCPNGCTVTAEYTCAQDLVLTGCACKRGIEYCTNECFDPKRTFTSSVRIEGASRRMLPVRTSAPVSLGLLMDCAKLTRSMTVQAPIQCHEVLVKNILGTGADLIAAMTLPVEQTRRIEK